MVLELSVHLHQACPLPQQHLRHHLPPCRFRPRACSLSHQGGASLPPHRPLSSTSAAFSSIPAAPIPSTPHPSSTLQVLKRICTLVLPPSSCYAAVILTITVSQAAWVLLVILRGRPSSCASVDQEADIVNELLTERRPSTAQQTLLNKLKLYLGLKSPQNASIQQEVQDVNQLLTGRRLGTAQKLLSRLERLQCPRKVGLVQQGGLGLALLSTTAMAKDHISPVLATLCANPTFMSALVAWAIAQVLKVFTTFFAERRWDLKMLVGSGGMPSSHSALCVALTTSVALCHGISDALFPVCLGFTLIVMYDATGVRRHAGMQAEVLNLIVEDMFQGHRVGQKKLKELLGHTPLQVGAGAVVGMLAGYLCSQGYQAFPGHTL